MKNLYKIQDELYIVSDKEKSSYCIKECPMAGLNIDRCDCQIFTACSNKVGNIILTTNKLLIKDGVQAINDEFLEWFVKNPSCNMVEISLEETQYGSGIYEYVIYKREIPKEELKQDWFCPKCNSYVSSECVTFEETHQICNTRVVIKETKQRLEKYSERFDNKENEVVDGIFDSKNWGNRIVKQETLTNDTNSHSWGFEVIKTEEDAKIFVETMENIPEPNEKLKKAFREYGKQETLEEAAENYSKLIPFVDEITTNNSKLDFIAGAKWQSERMYNELFEWLAAKDYLSDKVEVIQKEFEQFKKKK